MKALSPNLSVTNLSKGAEDSQDQQRGIGPVWALNTFTSLPGAGMTAPTDRQAGEIK